MGKQIAMTLIGHTLASTLYCILVTVFSIKSGSNMSTRIICTGGTFNKGYDPISGGLGFYKSIVPKILKTARCAIAVT